MGQLVVTGSGQPVPDPPGLPAGLRGRLVERARWEWRAGTTGNPWADLAGFLAGHGLGWSGGGLPVHGRPMPAGVVGAVLLLGHDASLPALGPQRSGPDGRGGALAGPVSPTPGLPAAAVVVCGLADAPHQVAGSTPPDSGSANGALADPADWQASWTDEQHAAAVQEVRAAIARGAVYQVNLVGHRKAPLVGDPAAVAGRVAGLAGAGYGGSMTGSGWAVHSASPECLLRVAGGRLVTEPIKGTWPIGTDSAAATASADRLRASRKDRAEHVMIVDLERNDLARVAQTGSVEVDELYVLQAWSGLWQATSRVSALLRPDVGLTELLAAMLPGGSVTGAPKLAALDLLHRLEPVGRGPAMGGLGWLGGGDTLNLGLTIRTIAVDMGLGEVHLWSGGGITWGSDPAQEVAEAEAKAAPIVAALGLRHP